MSSNYYLIRYENTVYANNELYIDAVARGEKAFIKLLSSKAVTGTPLMDQTIYPLTPTERALCEACDPIAQDFDEAVRHFNRVSQQTLEEIRHHKSEAFPNATVISVRRETIREFFTYRYLTFFKAMDYKENRKYYLLSKMAAVKICGRLYIAANAVDVRVETPIIASLVD